MPEIFSIKTNKRQAAILEEMRKRIAKEFGVTLQGNRLTVRWYVDDEPVDVHMVILSIFDSLVDDEETHPPYYGNERE